MFCTCQIFDSRSIVKFSSNWNGQIEGKLHIKKEDISAELLEFIKTLNSRRDALYQADTTIWFKWKGSSALNFLALA